MASVARYGSLDGAIGTLRTLDLEMHYADGDHAELRGIRLYYAE